MRIAIALAALLLAASCMRAAERNVPPDTPVDPARYPELAKQLRKLTTLEYRPDGVHFGEWTTIEVDACSFAARTVSNPRGAPVQVSDIVFDLQKLDLEGADFQGEASNGLLNMYCKEGQAPCGGRINSQPEPMTQLVFHTASHGQKAVLDILFELRTLCRNPAPIRAMKAEARRKG